jgi:branched-chain amino acid transport system permease protein
MMRLALALCVAAAMLAPLALAGDFVLHLGVMIAIMSVLALSMNLMLRIGQLSFAQAAFMGIGAYTSALLVMRTAIPSSLAFFLGGLVPAAIAFSLGRIFLRIRGVYFVLLTFAFSQVVNFIFQEGVSLFGGNNGLGSIPKFKVLGWQIASVRSQYICSLLLVSAAYWGVGCLLRSRVGVVLSALDQNENLGRSLGLDAMRWRICIFSLSAFLAGLAGGFYAFYVGFLAPSTFSFSLSVDALVMNVIGGTSIPLGPLIGALILVPLPELLRDAKQYQFLIYAAILSGSLLLFEDGLLDYLLRQFRRTRST